MIYLTFILKIGFTVKEYFIPVLLPIAVFLGSDSALYCDSECKTPISLEQQFYQSESDKSLWLDSEHTIQVEIVEVAEEVGMKI